MQCLSVRLWLSMWLCGILNMLQSLQPKKSKYHVSTYIAGRPKAALLFWFFGGFRCGALLFMVILVIYKYKNRKEIVVKC